MKQNNNFSVLPFYTDINLQNHRRSYAYGNIYPLVTPANMILPFQIMRPAKSTIVKSVILFDSDGNKVADITKEMTETGLSVVFNAIDGYDVIVYTGNLPLATNLFDGAYYLEIKDGTNTWYSDIFCEKHDLSQMIKIEWYDLENFVMDAGVIVYENPKFVNRLYFCTEIGKPEYNFDEEVEKRDGYQFPTKQISEKTYKFTILAPEYLCDVMRFIRMADFVKVTDQYGREFNCDSFLITPKWQTQGDIASVEVEFETDTIAKKCGRGLIREVMGDFNDDYNNDYHKK